MYFKHQDKAPEPSGHSSSEMERSTRKSRKVREVIIEDFDTLEELTDKNFNSNQMTGSIGNKRGTWSIYFQHILTNVNGFIKTLLLETSGEHLQTKKQLENVRAHFKEDWLRAHAGSTVQELLGLQPSSGLLGSSVASITSSTRPLSSSTPMGSPSLRVRHAPYPGCFDEQVLSSQKKSPVHQMLLFNNALPNFFGIYFSKSWKALFYGGALRAKIL